jgi:two-component system, LytTR family, sensor kinase
LADTGNFVQPIPRIPTIFTFQNSVFTLYLKKKEIPRHYIIVFVHLSLWLVFLGAPVFFSPDFKNDPLPAFMSMENRRWMSGGVNLLLLCFFYLNYSVLLPRIYLKGNSRQYFFSILLTFALFQTLVAVIRIFVFSSNWSVDSSESIIKISRVLSSAFFLMMWAASSGIRLSEEWRKTEMIRREADQRRTEAELALLKSQINPHFLLNTLNNLYALALTAPDKTPDALLKLSEMVAYVLYECNKKQVLIAQDLAFIDNYISLQRLRLAANVALRYSAPNEPVAGNIEPMILISFIENAFKHGLTTKHPCAIVIAIKVFGHQLNMQVENDIIAHHNIPLEKSGIGLANTRQRLESAYPKRYILQETENNGKHLVDLTIAF